jgi:hypothetical protein
VEFFANGQLVGAATALHAVWLNVPKGITPCGRWLVMTGKDPDSAPVQISVRLTEDEAGRHRAKFFGSSKLKHGWWTLA